MSNNKKRKSDVNIDACGTSSSDAKKDRLWFQENDPFNIQTTNETTSTRRKSFFGNVLNKFKGSKDAHKSSSKLESLNHSDAHMSINSESSLTSNESGKIPNIEKNAGLRTFVNRDSFTPVPPNEGSSNGKQIDEDSTSISSRMSVETADSVNLDDAILSSASSTSAIAFCTPSRVLNRNSLARISTRSVPDHQLFKDIDDHSTNMYNSLCNSVRRVPSTKSEGGSIFGSQQARRSIRMQMHRRLLNGSSMEDVPEEEPLANVMPALTPITTDDEEVFRNGKEFFEEDPEICESQSRESISSNRLSITSEQRKTPGSISRNNSFFRKMFKQNPKERRTSEICDDALGQANNRRSSIASFNDENATSSLSNHNDSGHLANPEEKVKLRKKTTSSSNLTQRISSVFSRKSTTCKDEDSMNYSMNKSSNRRSTLTGFSSISSGIGSIASEVSEYGSFGGTIGRSGASVSRNGSKRETDKERVRRFLDNIVISDIPADELLKMKIDQLKRRSERSLDEEFETQLDETGSSTSSATQELLNFDVVAVDIKSDGSSFSKVSEVLIDAEMNRKIRDEMKSRFPSDNCGTVVECEPDLIFVCSSTSCNNANSSFIAKDLNESTLSRVSVAQNLLIDVRNGISKSIELWNSSVFNRPSSTLLMFPMFCSTDNEWDSRETIDAIFCMLDAILNTRRWKPNGRIILAGLTVNNVRLLREKYLELKMSIADNIEIVEIDDVSTAHSDDTASSVSSMVTKV